MSLDLEQIDIDLVETSEIQFEIESQLPFRSPHLTVALISVYLLMIFAIVPRYMANRKAYSLKTFMIFYNIGQVLACIYIVTSMIKSEIPILKFWRCSAYRADSPEEKAMNGIYLFTYWLKVVELSETVVFILRKKQNQVSFLHVFHHCSTVSLIFVLVKYYRGDSALYPLLLNTNVHIIMYSYYLAAAVLPKSTVKMLLPIKKSITTIQMIQFTMILAQVATQIALGCKLPKIVVAYYTFVISTIFYLFYDFYKKSYNKSKTKNAA